MITYSLLQEPFKHHTLCACVRSWLRLQCTCWRGRSALCIVSCFLHSSTNGKFNAVVCLVSNMFLWLNRCQKTDFMLYSKENYCFKL